MWAYKQAKVVAMVRLNRWLWILIWGVYYLWLHAFPTVWSAQIHTVGSLGKVEKLSGPDEVIPA
jgi:hypothetical protein